MDMQTADNFMIFEDIEITILSVFLVEILLKIFGFGLTRYLGYRMNVFDMVVVLMALVGELVAASAHGGASIAQDLAGSTYTAVHDLCILASHTLSSFSCSAPAAAHLLPA